MESVEPVAAPAAAAPRRFSRDFLLLWQGQTVSHLGNQALVVAMMFWTMEVTGSASLMGLLIGLSALPAVLLAPFGGTLADRYPRIRIVVACDVLSGLALLALTAVFALAPDRHAALVALFAVGIFNSTVRAFFMPAISSAIPDLVPPARLPAANSLVQMSVQVSQSLGQALGGVLYKVLGPTLLFLIDGISYLYAAISSAFITTPKKPEPAAKEAVPLRTVLRGFLAQTREGLAYTWQRRGLRNFVLVAALINFFIAPVGVLLPFYVKQDLQAGPEWYGLLQAAISGGTVAGFLLAGMLKLQGETRGIALVAGLATGPLLLGSLGLTNIPAAALAIAFAGGAVIGLINIYLLTLIQLSTPPELRGRVLGLLTTLASGLLPIGAALGGMLGDLTGKNIPLVYGICGGLCTVTTLLLATRKECREFLGQ